MSLPNVEKKSLQISSTLTILALIPALIALIGIFFSEPILQRYFEDLPTMNLESVVGTILLAFSILVFNRSSLKSPEENSNSYIHQAQFALFSLIVIFLCTLIFYVHYYIHDLNEVVIPSLLSSVRTSVSFFILGACVFITHYSSKWRNYFGLLLLIPFYIAIIALTGYVTQISDYYFEVDGIGMSIPTSLTIILLVFAIFTGPSRKIGSGFLLAQETSGRLARRLLPLALLLPPLFTCLNLLLSKQGFYSFDMSIVLQVVGPCLLLSGAITWMTLNLIRSEIEIKQSKIEQKNLENINNAKNEFLAVLSHELRTPMNSILGFLELLPGLATDPEELKNTVQIIERNAKSEMRLIESILAVSYLVTGKLNLIIKKFNLQITVNNLFSSFEKDFKDKNIKTSLIVIPNMNYMINGDEERVEQIIWNLLTNALKFTPNGGDIKLELKQINSSAHLTIEDTGIGMTTEQIQNIFKSFWQADSSRTRKYGGLGIGLTLAYQLTKAHGGDILVESNGVGQGSKFVITLPTQPVRI